MNKKFILLLFVASILNAYTLEILTDDTQIRLKDPSGVFFTDKQVKSWLNYGQDSLFDDLVDDAMPELSSTTYISGVSGQDSYSLPSDTTTKGGVFSRPKLVRIKFSTSTSYVQAKVLDLSEMQKAKTNVFSTASKEEPYCYFWINKIFVMPAIDNNSSTIEVNYMGRPKPLSATTDTPSFAVNQQELLIYYAMYLGYTKDDKVEMALKMFSIYDNRIKSINSRYYRILKTEELKSYGSEATPR